jgi:pyridoxal phosphate enzyme (YggS family)
VTDALSRPEPAFDAAAARTEILERIAKAAREAGRDPAEVALTAVSKLQPEERVAAVLAAGQRVFGENRVQEAIGRWQARREGLELRLIGPLQTNKAREAMAFFDVIETLDRPRLAETLAREAQRAGRCPRLYVEINTGEEPQKAGVAPGEADAFIARCRGEWGLQLEGLMCIPPQDEPPAAHFALTARIAARNGLERLSMGMSADFEIAIAYGATSVRIGTALFGAR